MPAWTRSWALFGLLAGCQGGAELTPPDLAGRDLGSALLALSAGEGGGASVVYALTPDESGVLQLPPITGREGASLVLAAYRWPLGPLAPGLVPSPMADQRHRGLSPYAQAFQATLGSDPIEWSNVSELATPFTEIQIPAESPQACAVRGGCYLDAAAAGALACEPTCPEVVPTPPTPPAPVDMRPCPSGWREQIEAGAFDSSNVICLPPDACPADQLRGPSGCAPPGAACPSGDWATTASASSVWVKAGAAPGGSGGMADPFQRIVDALAVAVPGDAIMIAKGDYREPSLALPSGVTLRGACPGQTRLLPRDMVGLRVLGGGVKIEGLSVAGSTLSDVLLEVDTGDVEVEGVIFTGGRIAWSISAGKVRGRGLILRGAGLVEIDGFGAQIDLEHIQVGPAANNPDGAALRLDARSGTLALRDAIVLGPGPCFHLANGSATVSSAVFDGCGGDVIALAAARLSGEHVVVRGNHQLGAFAETYGVVLNEGCTLEARAWVLDDLFGRGLVSLNSSATLENLLIRGTRRDPACPLDVPCANLGLGLSVNSGELNVDRLLASHNDWYGLLLGPDAHVTINDLQVASSINPVVSEIDYRASCIRARDNTVLRVDRLAIDGCSYGGVVLTAAESRLEDVHMRGAQVVGLEIEEEGGAELNRVWIEATGTTGVCADQHSETTVRDLVVSGTGGADHIYVNTCSTGTEIFGVGVYIDIDARINLERFQVSASEGSGIVVDSHLKEAVHIQDGRVYDNSFGLRAQAGTEVEQFMSGVAFDNAGHDFHFSEEP